MKEGELSINTAEMTTMWRIKKIKINVED